MTRDYLMALIMILITGILVTWYVWVWIRYFLGKPMMRTGSRWITPIPLNSIKIFYGLCGFVGVLLILSYILLYPNLPVGYLILGLIFTILCFILFYGYSKNPSFLGDFQKLHPRISKALCLGFMLIGAYMMVLLIIYGA